MNIHVHVFVQTYVFISLGCITSLSARLNGKFMFHTFRNCQNVIQGSRTIFIPTRIHEVAHFSTSLSTLFMTAIVVGTEWFVLVLIYISLMIHGVD